MALEFTTNLIADAVSLFRYYKKLADGALAQVTDEEFFRALDEESNSIAIIVKHIAGNMRSRWTDFLESDGEKPWRRRDAEFELGAGETRTASIEQWESAWRILFAALEPLNETDLSRPVTIRGERHAVMQAINRQIAHYAYHVGQIVLLAKHWRGAEWQSLSIPRGGSAAFNRGVQAGTASRRSATGLPGTPPRR